MESVNIKDEYDQVYELSDVIFRKTCGTLYKVKERVSDKSCFAWLFDKTALCDRDCEFLLDRLDILNLDENYFLRPFSRLSYPTVGYVLKSIGDEFFPISRCWSFDDNDTLLTLFERTGDIDARYRMLLSLSRALLFLHSRGFILGEISPQSIYVSSSGRLLIADLSGITDRAYVRQNDDVSFGFLEPAVQSGYHRLSINSDSYLFAVLAYRLLTLRHPLIGESVDENSAESLKDAFCGKYPWVESGDSESNVSGGGIPSAYFVTPGIFELFEKSFGNHNAPHSCQPLMSEWNRALKSASEQLIYCEGCGMHYLLSPETADRDDVCPCCTEYSPDYVKAVQIKLLVSDFDVSGADLEVADFGSLPKRIVLKDQPIRTIVFSDGTEKQISESSINSDYEIECSENIIGIKYAKFLDAFQLKLLRGGSSIHLYFSTENDLDNFTKDTLSSKAKMLNIKASSPVGKSIVIGFKPFTQEQYVMVI